MTDLEQMEMRHKSNEFLLDYLNTLIKLQSHGIDCGSSIERVIARLEKEMVLL